MGREPEAYGWNDAVLAYDPAANSWGTLGDNPYLPNCDPAVVGQGEDAFLVIGGEIKPGLRTPQVKSVAVEGEAATWQELAEMPAPDGEAVQEGVAGAYAGEAGGAVLVAGGANFPGARANSEAGRWFAHDGLTKTWRSEVYALTDAGWRRWARCRRASPTARRSRSRTACSSSAARTARASRAPMSSS